MKRIVASLFLILLSVPAFADRFDRAVSKNAGNYVETYSITVNTITATQVIDPTLAIKSASIDVIPNYGYALFVGSNTATLQSTGFVVTASSTYTSDGTYTGSLYGMAAPAQAGNGNVRVIYWLKNDALN